MFCKTRFVIPYYLLIVSCLTTLAVGSNSSWAAGEGKSFPVISSPITVVELFTSQGCSACPPADKLLAEMVNQPGILPLSWSIDYWDYLGWRDTFGKPEHTERQRNYNRKLGLSGVYTPQVIVQGTVEAIGSRREDVINLVTSQQSLKTSETYPIKFHFKGNRLTVSLGKAKLPETASVWLVGFARERTVLVERGENKGQMLSYHNVVLTSGKLGEWTGKKANFSADVVTLRAADADGIAVLVQYDDSGLIIAAAEHPLRPLALDAHIDAPLEVSRR
ncbi:DUF1223 domain-containing protein [Govanella unica]|uniref:DUF1223 domain-containing protein n=1 Tax=Govanella unica TaxID=2975056 RepID=A0A9X3Z628_9PROT|nr:DUF1223 domain-containing protein [Govania unica]MDA5192706.1 DUF1223 domain-containing protein [Govania unica]